MRNIILFLTFICYVFPAYSQQNVGIGTTTPNASAILDITAADKGLLIPRVALNDHTSAAPVTSPAEGLMIYNATGTEPHGFWYWDGSQWVQVGTGFSASGGTLDDAYDFNGSGLGRTITADAGAVEINMPSGATNTEGLTVTAANGSTGTPASAINVLCSGVGASVYAENNNAANPYNTIQASTNSTNAYTSAIAGYYDGTNQGVGIYGSVYNSASSGVAGVMGVNNRTNGGYGIYGQGFNGGVGETNDAGGAGLWGQNNNGTGTGNACGVIGDGNYGVWGQTSYGQAGVFGLNARTSGGHGVWGQGVNGVVGESVNINGYGVWGSNSATSDPGIGTAGVGVTGVAGQSTNTSLSYGLYSYDDGGIYNQLDVGGNFYAGGTKSFRIDNPMDPDNKFLIHFSIESDEIMNIYRGTVSLNANGEAEVELPEYFHLINKNFSYNLTAIGMPAPNLYIKQKIRNGKFVIAGGAPNQEIDWVVYAERNDKYLQKNPQLRNTQPEKTDRYKGRYVHPQLWGQQAEKGILYKTEIQLLKGNNQLIPKKQPVDLNEINKNRK